MRYFEVTVDEAIDILRKSKGDKVMVAVHDLENEEDDAEFVVENKKDCEPMIAAGETIASVIDDYVKELNVFSKKQIDLESITNIGVQKIILLR